MLINATDLLNQINPGLNGQTSGDLAGLFASLLQNSLNGATPGERSALLEQLDALAAAPDGSLEIEQLLPEGGEQSIDLSALIQLLAAENSQTPDPAISTAAALASSQAAIEAGTGAKTETGGSSTAGQDSAAAQPTSQSAGAQASSGTFQGGPGPSGNADPNGAVAAPTATGSPESPEAVPSSASQAGRPESSGQSQLQSDRGAHAATTVTAGNGRQQPVAGSGSSPQVAAAGDTAGRQPSVTPDLPSSDDVEVSVSVNQRQAAPASALSSQVTAAILSSSDEAVTVTAGQATTQASQAAAQAESRDGRTRTATARGPQGEQAVTDASARGNGNAQSTAASAAATPNPGNDAFQAPKPSHPTPEPALPAIGGEPASSPQSQAGLHSGSGLTSGDATTAAVTQAGQPKPHSQLAKPAEQIAMHINRSLGEGRNRITVHLEPAALGKIEVKLDLAKDGTLRAMILADKPDTLDMLQRDSRMLERALQDAGVKTGADSLNYDLRGEGQAEQFAHQQGSANASGEPDAPLLDETPLPTEPSSAGSSHQGSLDISV